MSLVHNERTKLRATYLNGLAIAIFAVGGLAPLFSRLYGAAPDATPLWLALTVSIVCFLLSVALHLVADAALRRLKP